MDSPSPNHSRDWGSIGYDAAEALAKQGHKVYAAARRPRTRYRIGHLSTTMVFFHWLLPTRWWDGIVRMMGRRKWM